MANIAERNILFRIQTDTKKAQRDINAVKKDVTGLNGVVRNAAANFAGLAAFDVSGRIVSGLQDITKQSISLALASEQTNVAFETFLGSADKARAVLAELNQFSTVTPFEPEQVIQAGKALLAFGFSAEELIPNLKSIGDIAAGTGKDFNELTLIFGKARASGTVMAEELNQLTEAGVPIIQQFAKQFNVAESQIKDMASSGRISFSDLQQAFTELTSEGGKFFDLTAKQSRTVAGRISTLVGNFNALAKSIGERLLPAIGAATDFLNSFVSISRELVELSPAEELEKEQKELNLLVKELERSNTSEARRLEIIQILQRDYKNFIGNIDLEAASTGALAGRLREANQAFAARIALQVQEDNILKLQQVARAQVNDELAAEKRLLADVFEVAKEANVLDQIRGRTTREQVNSLRNAIGANEKFERALIRINQKEIFLEKQQAIRRDRLKEIEGAELDLVETQERLDPLLNTFNNLLRNQDEELKKTTISTKSLNKEEQKLADDREKRAGGFAAQVEKDRIAAQDELRKQIQETAKAEEKQNNERIRQAKKEAQDRKNQLDQDAKDFQNFLNEGSAALDEAQAKEDEAVERDRKRERDRREREKERRREQVRLAKQTADTLLSIAEQQTAAQIEQLDILLDAQRERVASAVVTAERGNAELLQSEEDRLNELTNARERAAERQRRIAQIQVAANQLVAVSEGIVAVTRAFAEGTFIQGIATSVALAAQVAAVIASINNAANSAQGFAEGTEFVTGPGTSTSDSIPARLSKGERVVPANINARYYDALNEFQYATPRADAMAGMLAGGGQSLDTSKMEAHLIHIGERLDNLEMNVNLDADGFNASMQKLNYRNRRKNKLT